MNLYDVRVGDTVCVRDLSGSITLRVISGTPTLVTGGGIGWCDRKWLVLEKGGVYPTAASLSGGSRGWSNDLLLYTPDAPPLMVFARSLYCDRDGADVVIKVPADARRVVVQVPSLFGIRELTMDLQTYCLTVQDRLS